MINRYLVIVIPTGKETTANIDADKVDTAKTSKTFNVGLSKDGKEPGTHFWCCWWVNDEEMITLREYFDPTDPKNQTDKNSSKIFILSKDFGINNVLEELNLKCVIPKTKEIAK